MLEECDGNGDMNKGVNEYYDCPARPDMEELTGALKLLTEKIDGLIVIYRDIVRWLLVVVCVIALGRSALDLGKSFFQAEFPSVRAEAAQK